MIDKEKLRELAIELYKCSVTVEGNERLIIKWLEQNHPEPVVVGLSDEQICELADYISDADYEHHFKSKSEVITEYLKTQTFAQPAVGNSDTSSNWDDAWIQELSTELAGFAYSKENIKSLITAFLDKIPNLSKVKVRYNPIVVGLSDEQIKGLGEYIYAHTEYDADYKWLIDVYLSKQTFVQHDRFLESQFNDVMAQLEQLKSQQDITDGGWRGKYDRLHIDYNLLLAELKEYRIREILMLDEQCKFKDQFDNLNMELEQLKSQQFTQNCEQALIDIKRMIRGSMIQARFGIFDKILDVIESVIKPTPQVEVGQVWKDESIKVKVGCLGRVSKNGEESIAFVDMDTNELKTWLLKTFITKFERVN